MEVTTSRQIEESIEVKEIIPDKNYVWEPEDTFTLTGAEYAALINGSRQQAAIIEGLFKLGVSKGIIRAAPEPPAPLVDSTVQEAVPLP
jgi:hypothetical protein